MRKDEQKRQISTSEGLSFRSFLHSLSHVQPHHRQKKRFEVTGEKKQISEEVVVLQQQNGLRSTTNLWKSTKQQTAVLSVRLLKKKSSKFKL